MNENNALLEKISAFESDIASLRSANDSTVIRFGQLGFRSAIECNAWMKTHHPRQDFGLLVDFHLVLEHIQVQQTSQKLMSNFEKIHKMRLDSNNQALAITSYETRIPRFFSARKDESYFGNIKDWDDWDLPNDGFRDRLILELQMFKAGHSETLETKLTPPLSPYYNLCVLALTESVSWIESLVKFVDDTYKEYSRCRYGSKKAWHITTRLARALIEKIAQPRNAIQNSFQISNPEKISKAITYATLKSLDMMMQIGSLGFKNSPIITAESTKFLALNSNYDLVEKIQSKLNSIDTEQASLKKEVKQAVSAAHTASNKWDSQVKSQVDDLKKRVKLVEGKL